MFNGEKKSHLLYIHNLIDRLTYKSINQRFIPFHLYFDCYHFKFILTQYCYIPCRYIDLHSKTNHLSFLNTNKHKNQELGEQSEMIWPSRAKHKEFFFSFNNDKNTCNILAVLQNYFCFYKMSIFFIFQLSINN